MKVRRRKEEKLVGVLCLGVWRRSRQPYVWRPLGHWLSTITIEGRQGFCNWSIWEIVENSFQEKSPPPLSSESHWKLTRILPRDVAVGESNNEKGEIITFSVSPYFDRRPCQLPTTLWISFISAIVHFCGRLTLALFVELRIGLLHSLLSVFMFVC